VNRRRAVDGERMNGSLSAIASPSKIATALGLLMALGGGCGQEGAGAPCADGTTKVCLSDDVTCLCAPPCVAETGACASYRLCSINESCQPCMSQVGQSFTYACSCVQNLCVPLSWAAGESFTFEPLTSDGGASYGVIDAARGAPNRWSDGGASDVARGAPDK
jgi:hypothetical protein